MRLFSLCGSSAALCVTLGLAPAVEAQGSVVNPATEQAKRDHENREPPKRLATWEMPPIDVKAGRVSELREEDRIGEYAQPRWTAHRRFPTTRIYVRPEGEFDIEFWSRSKVHRHGPTEEVTQLEVEFGLPHRFQLDLYLIGRKESPDQPRFFDQAIELRYALADWGVIPLNPTLYLEYISQDSASDKVEAKLLLGDELSVGWHYGMNFVVEQELKGSRETELEFTGGISHTIVDEKYSLGAETKLSIANAVGSRREWEEDLRVGPSVQFRPLPPMHIDIAPLFGITEKSKAADIFVVFGWEF